jgi:muramoyltetrapeptide carboxypeptidase
MKILKPPRLRHGDIIGIVAPSSTPRDFTSLENGIRYLEKNGYRVDVAQNISHRYGYLAGTDEVRASELNAMFRNKKIKAIFVARGGYGIHRILTKIDYALVRRNPKIVVGYSDVTALQMALWKNCNLVSLSAPLVVEFAEKLTGKQEEIFWQLLTTPTMKNITYDVRGTFCNIIHEKKNITGRIIGGNLSLFSTLCGTPFFPSLHNSIFYCEDIGEAPYRIDRMLHQLKLAKVFKDTAGIVLGNFTDCDALNENSLTLTQVFSDVFSDVQRSVVSGLQYGHCKESVAIPIGVRGKIHFQKKKLQLLESVVE